MKFGDFQRFFGFPCGDFHVGMSNIFFFGMSRNFGVAPVWERVWDMTFGSVMVLDDCILGYGL